LAVFWGGALPALAETLRVESLNLSWFAPWQRGPAEQEQADDVYLLDLRADQTVVSQIALLRRAPVIKGDADAGYENYYDRLTRFWRATYGKRVLIDWVEISGVKWRSLRRPASENGMGVFQLATVFEGRAYSLLVFVPGTVPVMDLLARLRFGSQAGEAGPAAEPIAAPLERWARSRTYRFNLSGDVLEAVVAADAERMGQDGMLTGYGLDYGESSVDWFMEGFEWKTVAGRVARVPWATRGRLEVDAPTELGDAAIWNLRLVLPEGEMGVSARLAVWDLCAHPDVLKEVLDRLKHGARGPMERLAATRQAACPGPVAANSGERLRGKPGKTATAAWSLPLLLPNPPRWAAQAAGSEPETRLSRVRLVEAAVEPGADRTAPGDGLLERARLFFAYEPR
jgi:hypothetical protein